MSTLLHEWAPVEVEEYVPTTEDLADYHRWSAGIDREDRTAELEKIRREDFNNARSAACQIRGMAASLGAYGMTGIAERLIAASDDVLALVTKYS